MDLEPDSGSIVDAVFERCRFVGNRAGLLAWLRSEVSGTIQFSAIDCEFADNPNGAWLKSEAARTDALRGDFTRCTVKRGSGSGIRVDQGAVASVEDCTFSQPTDRADFTLDGTDSRTKYDLASYNGGQVLAGTNRYT